MKKAPARTPVARKPRIEGGDVVALPCVSVAPVSRAVLPKGLGAFHRRISDTSPREVSKTVALAVACGFSEVYLMAEADSGFKNHPTRIETYAKALRSEGIDPWVWTFPGKLRAMGDQALVADTLRIAADAAEAVGGILDVELPYKGRPGSAKSLAEETLKIFPETFGIGMSTFGMLHLHRTLPAREFVHPRIFSMQQFYKVDEDKCDDGIKAHRAAGFLDLVFALPVFEESQARTPAGLRRYLGAMLPQTGGRAALWAMNAIERSEIPILREFSGR